MDKIKMFKEKHRIIAKIITILVVIFALKMSVMLIKHFLLLIGSGIIFLFEYLIELICAKQYWKLLIDICDITEIQAFNAVFLYLVLYSLFILIVAILKLLMLGMLKVIESCIIKIDGIVLGKYHQKSLEFKGITLWYIKSKADVLYFLEWLKFDVLNISYSYGDDYTKIKWARKLSLENIIVVVKNVIKFFFDITLAKLIFAVISVSIYYGKDILLHLKEIKDVIIENEITASQFLEVFEVTVVLGLIGYIFLDIRHKANGYSELRSKRFKELLQMEEKLLNILGGISYLLKKNIDFIANYKSSILQNGGTELSGRQCYIHNESIGFDKKNSFGYRYLGGEESQFFDLEEMEEELKKLLDLEEEYKKSVFGYSNIYLIDKKAMLMRVKRFWIPGIDDKAYMKMKFFCKSSMEEWYKDTFIMRLKNNSSEVKYYSEEKATEKILEVSELLDNELIRAFRLELYLKKYKRKLVKRFKKINKFSRFNLN